MKTATNPVASNATKLSKYSPFDDFEKQLKKAEKILLSSEVKIINVFVILIYGKFPCIIFHYKNHTGAIYWAKIFFKNEIEFNMIIETIFPDNPENASFNLNHPYP